MVVENIELNEEEFYTLLNSTLNGFDVKSREVVDIPES